MPTQIVDLDALVPDDIEFRYRGQKLVLPGDISVETTFRVQKLLVSLNAAEQNAQSAGKSGKAQENAIAEQERLTLEVEALLLGLFRQRDPDLESLPFGAVGFSHVLSMVLLKLGFGADIEDDDGPPTKAAPRKKSGRSATSRSS